MLYRVAGGIASATVGAVFYGNSLLGSILFFWLSSRWVPLQSEWRAMERCIDRSISRHSCQVHSLARFASLLIALFVAYLPCTRASIPVNRHCTGKLQLVCPTVNEMPIDSLIIQCKPFSRYNILPCILQFVVGRSFSNCRSILSLNSHWIKEIVGKDTDSLCSFTRAISRVTQHSDSERFELIRTRPIIGREISGECGIEFPCPRSRSRQRKVRTRSSYSTNRQTREQTCCHYSFTASAYLSFYNLQQLHRTDAAAMEIFLPKFGDTDVGSDRAHPKHVQQRGWLRLERVEFHVSQLPGDLYFALAFLHLRYMWDSTALNGKTKRQTLQRQWHRLISVTFVSSELQLCLRTVHLRR